MFEWVLDTPLFCVFVLHFDFKFSAALYMNKTRKYINITKVYVYLLFFWYKYELVRRYYD